MTKALDAIRNIAFVGHPASGKTTLVDNLAHKVGASARRGSVAEKTSICDTEPEEQEKGHTLQMAVVQGEHGGRSWTFFDTPGYPEFIADVLAAIHASELVVGVASCSSGVTYNLRKKLEAATRQGKGRAVVVTHVDGENADFDALLADLRSSVGEVCVPFRVPDQSGPGFSAVTRVLEDDSSDWRKRAIDRVMDACEDEELLERYLETETLSEEELRANVPQAIAAGAIVPVFACNPDGDVGVAELLEFLSEFSPSPGAYPAPRTSEDEEVALDPEGALCGTVFAVRSDPHVGKISMAKIHRGTLGSHDHILGSTSADRGEKPGGLFSSVGKKKREPVEGAKPGEIVAFAKVEKVDYGDTFGKAGETIVTVPMPTQPRPMVTLAVEPKSRADEQKIGEALVKLSAEDPCFVTEFDRDTNEMVMRGMSDLHLQVMEGRLKRRYGVEITTHSPRIHYLETITKSAEGHHRHKKQTGGRGQFGECYVRVKPGEKGQGFVFVDAIKQGSIPRNLIPAVEKGMRELAQQGILTTGRVVDVQVELYDGKFHAVDSDEASFKTAGSRALMDGFQKAGPILLEPVMEMIISVPTDDAGSIFSDITSHRRGQVLDQWNEDDGAITVIKAQVPLATVQNYHRDLKSQTAGEGSYALEFSNYSPVPPSEQGKVLAEVGRQHASD